MKKNTLTKLILGSRYFIHLLFTNFYHLGKRVSFKTGVVIENGSHISLGNHVYLESRVTLKFLEEFENISFNRPNLILDDNVFIGTGTIIAAAKLIHLKKNVMVGPHCFIGDHDHGYTNVRLPIKEQGYANIESIEIQEGAWIAANVTICSGVTIGRNSVIGANSVVTNDIPSFSVAVGAPAKVVKKFNKITKAWEKVKK